MFFRWNFNENRKNRVGRIPQPYLRLYGTGIFMKIMIFWNFMEFLNEIPWHVYGVFAQFRKIGEFLEVMWFLGALRKQANSRAECKEISGALRVSEKNTWIHVNPPTAPSAGQNKGEMSRAELLKIVVWLVFWREIKIFMNFDGKSSSFGWVFKGSAAFSVISCEIHETTRPAFAKTHLAGKLKGLGDVRNRWKIDEIAPSRQEGLLAVFLRRNRRWSGDLDENRGEIQCRSMLDPGG